MVQRSIYNLIEDINYEWIKDAEQYGNETGNKRWSWYSDITEVSFSIPFHRTITGYDHTYFVLDIDPTIVLHDDIESLKDDALAYRETCIRGIVKFVKQFLDSTHHKFFAKLSGSGIHLLQRIPERINKKRMKPVVRHLFPPCSKSLDNETHVCQVSCNGWSYEKYWDERREQWVYDKQAWSRLFYDEETNATLRMSIDLNMFKSGPRLIRWTYSRNQKVPAMFNYSIPIDDFDPEWVLYHMTRAGLEVNPPHRYIIPPFSFTELLSPDDIDDEDIVPVPSRHVPHHRDTSYSINVPDVGEELTEEQYARIQEMLDTVTGDVSETPPCVQLSYEHSMKLGKQFWKRVTVARYLSGKGYNVDDIALFFRFHVNDETDNHKSRKHKLIISLKEAYGDLDHPDMVAGCANMREHDDFGIVSEKDCMLCGRSYPLSNYSLLKDQQQETDVGWRRIQTLCRNILLDGNNVIIKKSTRAGVTTSLIAMTKLVGKKMLVVTPTNRIGEKTIPNALRIAKESLGIDVRGAMFASNKRACLDLVLLGKDIRHRKRNEPTWGGNTNIIAFDRLHYNNRPRCDRCPFVTTHYNTLRYFGNDPNSYPIPVLHAEVRNWEPGIDHNNVDGNCAYVTVRDHLREIDVMFTTYSKLNALMQNDTQDAQMIRDAIIDHFDVVLLDEVSYLTNQSALIVPLFQTSRKRNDYTQTECTINIFNELTSESHSLTTVSETNTADAANEMRITFTNTFQDVTTLTSCKYNIERILNRDDKIVSDIRREHLQDNFAAYHGIIETTARENNEHLEKTEDLFHLLNTERVIKLSLPTTFHPVDIRLVAEPDISYLRRFFRFFEAYGKQLLVTDATLPYIDIDKFLGVKLDESIVGDPRNTNDHQLIIADSKRLSVESLFFGASSEETQNDLIQFINGVCNEHGNDNVYIITSNIWTHRKLKDLMSKDIIPLCDITWFRSDKTVGVESDKRVMICITAPHPPNHSHDWLAEWYHEQGIGINEPVPVLGKNLSDNSTKSTFYQTIGRSKDPECKERSVVYLWGITSRRDDMGNPGARELMIFDDTDIPLPHITYAPRRRGIDRGSFAAKMGRLWQDHRKLLSHDEIRIIIKVLQKRVVTSYRPGRSSFKDIYDKKKNQMVPMTRERLEQLINGIDDTVLNIFDIEVVIEVRNNNRYFTLRRKLT